MASYGNPQRGSRSPHAGSGRGARTAGFTRPYSKRGATSRAWGTQGQGRTHGHGRGGSQGSYNEVLAGPRLSHSSNSQLRSKQSKSRTTNRDSSNVEEPSTEIQARMAAIYKSGERHRERISGSESEEEDEDTEYNELLRSTLKMYYQDLNMAASDLAVPGDVLISSSMLAGTGSCLVCLSSIRRPQAVWSCIQCYCLFHLQCIQQWVRDGTRQQTLLSPELFPAQELCWSCPKCRRDYPHSQFPQEYVCFCGKQVDPPVDPWLLPHSCGEICDKPLQPECGHMCVSLCHPGPCPPCPKTTHVTCYCGRSQPMVKRCGVRGWSCGRVCRRVLSCELHTCEQRCHEGDCSPCDQVVSQRCQCGKEAHVRPCAAPEWQCTQLCCKLLPCGNHHCEKVCHSGACGDCPKSGVRTCPCGKTKHTLPCTEDVPTCGDTCSKDLPCGRHKCMRQCHYGDCGQCLQMAVKLCRCGRKEKSLACSSEYLCEAKCQRVRQCGMHQCRRKCCDGNCPPCEQTCGRTLGCRNHKCNAPCHARRCYPCVLTIDVTCNCGATRLTVPCGREKATKPPKCRELCKKPPSCHHTEREPHYCHFRPCPPCKQRCEKPLPCGHSCSALCHSEPRVPKQALARPAGVAPWVKVDRSNLEPVVEPCPPCREPMPKACKGGHEVSQIPCCEMREYSCDRRCGRKLACGNHLCERGCHVVIDPKEKDQAGEDCLPCERGCEKPRPAGCLHPCTLPCHPGDCPTCEILVKLRCHCVTMNLFVKCCEWVVADRAKKLELQTCNSQCTKTLSCGHRCPLQCHAGDCLNPEQCKRRVTLRCPCRRIKKEARCYDRQEKAVECDSECRRIQREKEEECRRAEEEARRLEAERELREKQEALERELQRPKRRRRRGRKVEEEEEEDSFYQRHRTAIFVLGGAVLAGVAVSVGYMQRLL